MNYAKELIERTSTVTTTAIFSKTGNERYLLKSQWDENGKSLVIIMTFPSSADELIFDQTTMLVRNNAVKHGFGSVSIVNLFPYIGGKTQKTDKPNNSIVMKECETADTIIVAYGRERSNEDIKQQFLQMLSVYQEKLYTIIDSKGLPFSHPLSPLAHEWKIEHLLLEK